MSHSSNNAFSRGRRGPKPAFRPAPAVADAYSFAQQFVPKSSKSSHGFEGRPSRSSNASIANSRYAPRTSDRYTPGAYRSEKPRSYSNSNGSYSQGSSSGYTDGRSGGYSRGGYSGGSGQGYSNRHSGGYSQRGPSSYSRFGGRSGGRFARGGNRPRFGGSSGGDSYSKYINKITDTSHLDEEAKKAAEFKPKHTFNDFEIAEEIKTRIAAKGFVNPSPIQDASIPYVLQGKDVIGIANTGTGKTLAFLIPLVDKVINNPKEEVLIMAPTRELAIQIQEELLILIKHTKMYSVCCVGGAHIRKQISELRYFNNFIIGTPGRLKDLGEKRYIDFSKFTSLVLDEADRMLDMGFINEMREIIGKMPKERQTLFFTATMSREIQALVHEFLTDPVTVSVKTGDTSKSVDQDVVRIKRGEQKIDKLHELLSNTEEFKKVLVFGQTKSGVERLTEDLKTRGHKVASIHGDKDHYQRQKALKLFKDDIINILIATDVAARGLDIRGVTHVINYELPMTYDDYVHRIGRTGRGGAVGKALTFVPGH